jgi:transcription factor SPN1
LTNSNSFVLITDADNNDSDADDKEKGLFDDSDDDDHDDNVKPAPKKKLSKRELMEALRAKRRQDHGEPATKKATKEGDEEKGYDSGDSYNSAEFVRTQADNDFIDMDDDDPDAINELYAEQRFDDERGDSGEEDQKKKKKKGASQPRRRGPDAVSDDDDEAELNPIMAAVHKMKKKKRTAKKLSDMEEEAKDFLAKMEQAADDDDLAIRERRPGTKKLAMLHEVLDMLARRDMMRLLLDMELLSVCKRWIQPLPNGSLGNVTVRQQLLDAIGKMTGEQGVTSSDLKRSEFGKVVMALCVHKLETPAMKRQLKNLIEQWSRPIFQKSGNMRDLEHVQASSRREAGGVTAIAAARAQSATAKTPKANERDLQDMIASGSRAGNKGESNRVQIPYSKGFKFTVRPQGKTGDVADQRMVRGGPAKDTRGHLSKRMVEKGRAATKNQRSANISVEGRPTK